jgi:hypothetical protein
MDGEPGSIYLCASGWSINDPGDNYHYSFLRATMYWAVASQNQQWLDFVRLQKAPALTAYFAKLPGGGSLEGTGYGTSERHLQFPRRHLQASRLPPEAHAVTENMNTHSGIEQGTEVHNVLLFTANDGADTIIQEQSDSASKLEFQDDDAILTASADLSNMYHKAKRVQTWRRSIVFDRPANAVTVRDTFAVQSGVTAAWQLNAPVQPIMQGDSIVAGALVRGLANGILVRSRSRSGKFLCCPQYEWDAIGLP